MTDKPRDTPSAFDIFGTNTGEATSAFDLFDTRTLSDPENTENAEKLFGTDDIPELPIFGLGKTDFTPEENDWVDGVISAPRGMLRGLARTIPVMGEGIWFLLDTATNLTGNEDYINPRESAFIDRMDELRDAIGYEDSVAGRTGEALGSILGFVGTTFLTGGASAAARVGAGVKALKAGDIAAGGAKTLGAATQIAAPGIAMGEGEISSRAREWEEKTGEDISIADRNMMAFWGIPLGASEVLPIVRPLSILFSKIRKTDLPKRTLDTYMDYAKSAAITGTAEGVQEALAGIGQDAIAKGYYDEDAVIGESIASEFGYGGGAGAIFDIGVNLLTKGRPRGRPPAGTPEEGAPIPEEGTPSPIITAEEEQEIIDQSIPRDVVGQVFGDEEIVLPDEPVVPVTKQEIKLNDEIINATVDSPQAEIEATAQILKDETPPVVLQEDIETEAFKQQRTKVNPKLESAINREIELENEIEQAEQQEELNKADTLKNELVSIQQQQEELIKEEKVPVKRGRLIESFNRPDDNEVFTGRFPDKQSIDTYNNKNSKKLKLIWV